jgi:hypothetical protein
MFRRIGQARTHLLLLGALGAVIGAMVTGLGGTGSTGAAQAEAAAAGSAAAERSATVRPGGEAAPETSASVTGAPAEPSLPPTPSSTAPAPDPAVPRLSADPGRKTAVGADPAAAPPLPPPVPAAPRSPSPAAPRIPVGKGMWLYQLAMASGGDAEAVVRQAKAVGLTHLYLRLGSSKSGFYAQDELDRLLPVAHAAGLKVVGWDFVYLTDPLADAVRSKSEIDYVTPTGHRVDAFSADIETAAEGVNLTPEGAEAYGTKLRELAGPDYPLVATVPRPSPKRPFPFAEATRHFDAIAPMVYWMNRDPADDVARAIADLAPLGKPILPIGQAYDGGPEGGPAGDPPKDALVRFMDTALSRGALGVSFWVWHHTTDEQWAAIEEARTWELPATNPSDRPRAAFLQRVISAFGQPIAQDGLIGPATRSALAAVQQSLGLPGTGRLDAPTLRRLVGPRR